MAGETQKFLSDSGVTTLWSRIKAKFSYKLVAGNNVSITTDDEHETVTVSATDTTYSPATQSSNGLMSLTDKTKLDNIAAGAEVNVQADWNQTNASADDYIKNKPTIPGAQNMFSTIKVGQINITPDSTTDVFEVVAGSNIGLTANANTDQLTVAVSTLSSVDTSAGVPTSNAVKTYVDNAITSAQVGSAKFQGTVDSQTTISSSSYKTGWYWVVSTAGTYFGEVCEIGDMIFAVRDKGASAANTDFSFVQSNISLTAMTTADIDTAIASA